MRVKRKMELDLGMVSSTILMAFAIKDSLKME